MLKFAYFTQNSLVPGNCDGDRFAYDCAHHHSPFANRIVPARRLIGPQKCGLSRFPSVSKSVSARCRAGFRRLVSALEISVPGVSGDRFDDWVVGHQFEPYCLHRPALAKFPAGRQTGRFCGDFGHRILGLWSPNSWTSVSACGGAFEGDFWRPVSAFKNSVPGGRARARFPTAFAAAIAISSQLNSRSRGGLDYSGFRPSASNCRGTRSTRRTSASHIRRPASPSK